MLCFPNAKINIGLNIIEKRSDKFHNIETIFYPIPFMDGLEIAASNNKNTYEFTASGIPVNINDKDNIVCKAFELIRSQHNIPATTIHLHKNIPFGAGLGGGSADAAFMIKMLNKYYKLDLSTKKMELLAGQLGSDCPFFIQNKAVFAEEKGDVFSETSIKLKGYHLLLVKPDVHISTPEAYANVSPEKPANSLQDLIKLPIEEWKDKIGNDFEKSIFPGHPILKTIKDELYETGATYASMSGSGSSLFGIFKDTPEPTAILKNHFCWIGKLD